MRSITLAALAVAAFVTAMTFDKTDANAVVCGRAHTVPDALDHMAQLLLTPTLTLTTLTPTLAVTGVGCG